MLFFVYILIIYVLDVLGMCTVNSQSHCVDCTTVLALECTASEHHCFCFFVFLIHIHKRGSSLHLV